MKNQKPLVFVIVVAISALLIYKMTQKDRAQTKQESVVAQEEVPASTLSQIRSAQAPQPTLSASTLTPSATADAAAPAPTPAKRKLQPVAKLLPAAEKAREEVAEDPHDTPKSVILFSSDLTDRLNAIQNEQQADSFMSELDSCVTKPARPTTESARTLCLLNANKLAKKYPTLDAKYSDLENRAEPRVRSAVKFLK